MTKNNYLKLVKILVKKTKGKIAKNNKKEEK